MRIPEGWKEGKVSDLIKSLDSGVSVNSEDKRPEDGQFSVLKTSCVSSGSFNRNERKVVLDINEIGRLKEPVKGNTIIISRMNTPALVGANAYIPESLENTYLPDRLWQVKSRKESVNMLWLGLWFSSKHTRYLLSNLATGTSGTMKNITKSDVLSIKINIPTPPEQLKIAQILSTWDKAIEKLEALIAAKKKRKKALMQQLLTGKKRFSEFDKEWKTFHLGDLFEERNETRFNDLNLLSITREKGVIPRDEVERRDTSNEDKSKYLRICPGDIGYNTMRMWQGVSAVSDLEGIVSPAYTVCKPRNNVDGRFITYLFKLTYLMHLFQRYSQGLTSDTWNLKFRHFSEIKVRIPMLIEQQKIAAILSVADKEIAIHQNQLTTLKQQKIGLMQQLLTGKKRVNVGKVV